MPYITDNEELSRRINQEEEPGVEDLAEVDEIINGIKERMSAGEFSKEEAISEIIRLLKGLLPRAERIEKDKSRRIRGGRYIGEISIKKGEEKSEE